MKVVSTKSLIRKRLREWIKTRDHYYVGYEFDGRSPSFDSLVRKVEAILKEIHATNIN